MDSPHDWRITRALTRGRARGAIARLHEPLSFWGGFDSATGAIIDRAHPQVGRVLTGNVLVMAGARGSSSASSVLAEAIRRGTAPVAIVLEVADPILPIGGLVADLLYGLQCPIVVVGDLGGLRDGLRVDVDTARGTITLISA